MVKNAYIRGDTYNYITSKLRNNILNPLLFPEDVVYEIRYKIFMQTRLGIIHQSIPLKELADLFRDSKQHPTFGRKPIFEIEDGLGLMFLKHYFQKSDEKLIKRLNAVWQMQMFCGIQLGIAREIRYTDIVGRWCRFFGERLDIDMSQDVLAEHWDPYTA